MHLDQLEFLRVLERLSPSSNVPVVRNCGTTGANAICECVHNLLINSANFNLKQRRHLAKKLKPFIAELTKLKTPLTPKEEKKEALAKISGEPLKFILKKLKPTLNQLKKEKETRARERRRRRGEK